VSKPSDRTSLGSLATGAVTAVALAVQTGLAAVVGVIIAREFGRTAETDGFFAAYGVFIVLALAANTVRLVVLPPLARARADGRLAAETSAWAASLGLLVGPVLIAALVLDDPLGALLTANGPQAARQAAAATLPLVVVAGVGQLYAGLAASALAALDDYVTPAVGFILGSVVGLAVILVLLDAHGIRAVAVGMAVNGLLAVAVPGVALALRARRSAVPRSGLVPHRDDEGLGARTLRVARGSALPLALQAAYLVALAVAAREGVGGQTSFGYAYLAGSAVVAATAASFGLATSVPLTRAGLDAFRVAHHVVATSWLALIAVGLTAGTFLVAGEPIVSRVLGTGYADTVGDELGRLIAAFAPWMVAAIGFTLAFPLAFVAARDAGLGWLALAALAVQGVLAPLGQATLGLNGLVLALTVTTALALAALLHRLSAARATFAGLVRAALVVGVLTVPWFLASALLLPDVAAALAGLALSAAALLVVRPAGLRDAVGYLRALS
jgi:hypothetical protein